MKYLIIVLSIFFSLAFIIEKQQPSPYTNNNITIQPIVENIETTGSIRAIKIYYTDSLVRPFVFKKGKPLLSYCSDNSTAQFITQYDTLHIQSTKRMSCEILAIFNLSPSSIMFLKTNPIDKIIVCNTLTENCYECIFTDNRNYFIDAFSEYHKQD
jgi:hypothetical protein